MKFDVVIGNPPYQLKGGAGGTNDASIHPQFVDQARALDARFLVMVILRGGSREGAIWASFETQCSKAAMLGVSLTIPK